MAQLKAYKDLKRPRANSLVDPVRASFTIEREYHEKIKILSADDSRSTFEWLRVKVMELVDREFPALEARLEHEREEAVLATIGEE